MTIEGQRFESREREPILDTNIVSLKYCKTIDEMIERIEVAKTEGAVDSVSLTEYNFKVEEFLSEIEKIRETARQNNVDIILAPDNQFGRNVSWGQIKRELRERGVNIEETEIPDEYHPETIGIFVDKTGSMYAFPKTWHWKEIHRPVHKIPNTKIGVTICGEIWEIRPEDLEDINILYNPSREGDDPMLEFRMRYRYGSKSLTREDVTKILLEKEFYKNMMDDSQNDPNSPDYIPEYDSREERERRFNEAVDNYFGKATDPKNSMYVGQIEEPLREKGIPVVRTDSVTTTGVLNYLPNAKISGLEYRDGYTRYNLTLEK